MRSVDARQIKRTRTHSIDQMRVVRLAGRCQASGSQIRMDACLCVLFVLLFGCLATNRTKTDRRCD
ncbi:hypothetical protein T4E_8233 [Trichinella pseudospiralis]|uniref:Uncharacterized protein n=1 Tax=Trichinella pseudospiralis TaxID=6337 RepID=A0A0V0XXN8_TRIPS|nr:hypothetical protein T4E_8233 [Trichinella pseudospiralis]